MHIEVDNEAAELASGDGFRFASSRPSRFWNEGTAPAMVIWAPTSPIYWPHRPAGHARP